VITVHSELRKVLFWRSDFFVCVWNISETAERIFAKFTQDVFDPSLGRVGMSRSKVKVTRDKNRHLSAISAAWVRLMFDKTSLASSYGRPMEQGRPFLYFCPVVSSSIFYLLSSIFYHLFFLAYSQPSQTGCLPYFNTCCGLSANLECRSEVYCMRLAENTACKKRHLGTIAQIWRAISSQLRHVLTIAKKTF